ncbi:MAG: WG repeat-containing protein, partial [Defluviitaleaceae bacterium]|nr:WG repeat-containing protein [Defluviitaleaceae bacterium]
DGWFAVQYGGRADGLWGLLDDNGREVIPPMYTYLGTFMDGLALVSIGGDRIFYATGELCGYMMPVGGQWLLIDKENNVVAAFQYSAMQRVSHNLLAFSESVIYRTNPHLPTDRRVQSAEWGFIAIEFDAPSFLE